MNTKRQNKRQKQSKKVKRKTKTYKKRSIRKYGGNWFNRPHYLYSAMTHGLEKRPMYKFNVDKKMGQGKFASAYLGNIQCEPKKERVCIKEYEEEPSSSERDIIPMFSQTLQNMKNKYQGGSESSFPFNKKYLLRIYGKKDENEYTQDEFRGTELHKRLSQECSNYVCTLFDYGTILKKNYISRYFGQKYQEKAGSINTCQENGCLYALLEKGKMDMFRYVVKIDPEENFTAYIRELYIIAMKMIRNIYCLHSKNIMHYDIKLENCVYFPMNTKSEEINIEEIEKICNLNENFINDVKLIDFGFAEELNQNNYKQGMMIKGSEGLLYGRKVNDKVEMYHSRFLDIFAILKQISWLPEVWNYTDSKIFSIFKNGRNSIAVEYDLPDFLKIQVKLLDAESLNFNNEPYQNILTKLKEEYLTWV